MNEIKGKKTEKDSNAFEYDVKISCLGFKINWEEGHSNLGSNKVKDIPKAINVAILRECTCLIEGEVLVYEHNLPCASSDALISYLMRIASLMTTTLKDTEIGKYSWLFSGHL